MELGDRHNLGLNDRLPLWQLVRVESGNRLSLSPVVPGDQNDCITRISALTERFKERYQ